MFAKNNNQTFEAAGALSEKKTSTCPRLCSLSANEQAIQTGLKRGHELIKTGAMKTNEYELLLNRIYTRNLPEKSGDQNVYSKMQKEYKNLNQVHSKNCIRRCEFEFKKSFFIVRNFVQQAIKDGLKHFQFNMGNEDIAKLTYMEAMLNRNFFDKSSLDQIIAKANTVFSQYN